MKALISSPGLQRQVSDSLAPLISSKDRNSRSTSLESDLKQIFDEIITEVNNIKGERVIPAFVLWVGYAAGGATVGSAVGIIGKKIWGAITD